jgi:hypothetical protein
MITSAPAADSRVLNPRPRPEFEPVTTASIGSMAGVLDRNISFDFAGDFKARAVGRIAELAQLVGGQLPWLPREFTEFFAEAAPTLVAGMYPSSVPTEPVRAAIAELGLPDPGERFREGLRIGLVTWLIGAAAQTEA